MNASAAKIDIAWLGEAWNVLRSRIGEFIAMTVVGLVISQVIGFMINIPFQIIFATIGGENLGVFFGALMGQMFVSFLAQGLTYVLWAGMMIFTLKVLRGEPAKFEDLFAGFKNFLPNFIAGIVYGFALGLGFLFCCIPGILLGGLLMFVFPLINDKKLQPMEAFSESVRLLKDQLGMATVYFFLSWLFAIAGIIACGVGILVTYPIMLIAPVLAYHKIVGGATGIFTGPGQYPRDPATVSNMPPAPTSWPGQEHPTPAEEAAADATIAVERPAEPVSAPEPGPADPSATMAEAPVADDATLAEIPATPQPDTDSTLGGAEAYKDEPKP